MEGNGPPDFDRWCSSAPAWRKYPRDELRESLSEALRLDAGRARATIENASRELAACDRSLRAGVYVRGARKGEPYSARRRAEIEARRDELLEQVRAARVELEQIASAPAPLRAWGLYAAVNDRVARG
jgi:hypothetical protein